MEVMVQIQFFQQLHQQVVAVLVKVEDELIMVNLVVLVVEQVEVPLHQEQVDQVILLPLVHLKVILVEITQQLLLMEEVVEEVLLLQVLMELLVVGEMEEMD